MKHFTVNDALMNELRILDREAAIQFLTIHYYSCCFVLTMSLLLQLPSALRSSKGERTA